MPITILHITQHLTGTSDGIFNHLLMIINNLTNDDFKHLVLLDRKNEAYYRLKEKNIDVFILNEINKKIPIKFIISLIKLLKDKDIKIIQTHSTKSYIIFGLLNILLKRKHIFNYNGIFIWNKYYNLLEKILLHLLHFLIYIFNGCQLVICPSKLSLEVLKRESKLFRDFKWYYNSLINEINVEINRELENYFIKLKEKFFLVGIIGRIEIQKRVDLAINLMKLIKDNGIDDIFFVFVGDGPLFNEMIKLAKKLKVTNNMDFIGYIPNIRFYFNYFDTILFTSEWEGFPLTIWEAMKYGTPVISSDVGGAREILLSENCGYVYKFGDLNTCLKLILALKSNNNLRSLLGNNGKQALLKYNKEFFNKCFEEIYRSVL